MTRNQDLRAELLRRMERDRAARLALLAEHGKQEDGKQEDGKQSAEFFEAFKAVAAIDGENLAWFSTVIAESGWPGQSAVGEDGARAAWVLVQHADADPAADCPDCGKTVTITPGSSVPRRQSP